ncbi:MAG: hypothetical protein JXB04_12975 [Kiritimatiellae bacterium]|nr:hypothetical protein [Kiritimatiellia bacterium]
MSPSLADRCEIYRKVRTIFVRHFIDLGRLSIHISMNYVHMHGMLVRLPGVGAELTPAIIDEIFKEIGRIPGVARVDSNFENWERDTSLGAWRPIVKSPETHPFMGRDFPLRVPPPDALPSA